MILTPGHERADLGTLRTGIKGGWVSDEYGSAAARTVYDILVNPETPAKTRIAAARTLAVLASVDVRRERNAVVSRLGHVHAATAALRASLALPGAREALAALSDATCTNDHGAQTQSEDAPPSGRPSDNVSDTVHTATGHAPTSPQCPQKNEGEGP